MWSNWKSRKSAAKAALICCLYGTAEAVPNKELLYKESLVVTQILESAQDWLGGDTVRWTGCDSILLNFIVFVWRDRPSRVPSNTSASLR